MAPLRSVVVLAAVSLGAAPSLGCVSKVIYDREVADAAKAQADADAKQKDDAAQIQALQEQLTAAEATTQDRDSKLSELSTTSHNLQAQLDEATAINQQLRGELERLGKDVDKILADRGTLSKALDDAKARLDELRKAQAAAEARTQLFQDLGRRFQALVSAGQLRVESRGGRLVVSVKGDLLFDAGKAELRSAGKGALMEIARALETAPPGRVAALPRDRERRRRAREVQALRVELGPDHGARGDGREVPRVARRAGELAHRGGRRLVRPARPERQRRGARQEPPRGDRRPPGLRRARAADDRRRAVPATPQATK